MKNKYAAALCATTLLGASSVQAAIITHYDIDFSSPTHTLGSVPATGPSSDTPSSVVFGQPVVESSLGALSDQALVFNTTGNTTPCCFYDQIELDLNAGYDNYQLSFDLSTDNYVDSGSTNNFAVLFDTPQVRRIDFENSGDVSTYQPFLGTSTIGTDVFDDNELLSMLVDIDLGLNTWDIFLNSSLLHSGFFDTSGSDIGSVRFSLGSASTTHFDSVGLDNILLTSRVGVPEPSTLMLLGAGLLGFSQLRKARAHS